ncbi:hypothetical protein [uncultured Paraglaciecola sp.]|uniref:hypothetical protein n=1 Tax=uncultured Paraglaciecola sp. TaxID=1765024 RepID=UPI0026088D1B|nr:hypothetical protein [uncultured Paraglaciecola sp.]
MVFFKLVPFVAIALFVFTAHSKTPETKFNQDAPEQVRHWQKMLGSWRTTEESLKPDGSGWKQAGSADWHFYTTLNGWAVQDEYFSPPLSEEVAPASKRQMGTNIRVFDNDKKQWLMIWTTTAGKAVNLFSAESNDKQIVMRSKQKTPQGKYSRITFFDLQKNSFEWKLEWSNDGKNNWLEVHRIHGLRVK